jgi:o-succinylbenzoate synthase
MQYRLHYYPYHRPFKRPLQTSHGLWSVRSGIILQLIDDRGTVGLGEIAPLPWFGTETLEEALAFCDRFPSEITTDTLLAVPDRFPACQFGFESALDDAIAHRERQHTAPLQGDGEDLPDRLATLPLSYLLPAGSAAFSVLEATLTALPELPQQNPDLCRHGISTHDGECHISTHEGECHSPLQGVATCTFKWKIGIADLEWELDTFHQLMSVLPTACQLRLDANGGLNFDRAVRWLEEIDRYPNVEFIEQPLPVANFPQMLELSQHYRTPIALDESVASLSQLQTCYDRGWRGIFVIKPAIAGSPAQLSRICQQYDLDTVFSSVFETPIGTQASLQLAARLQKHPRAVGFGVDGWFVQSGDRWWQDFLSKDCNISNQCRTI